MQQPSLIGCVLLGFVVGLVAGWSRFGISRAQAAPASDTRYAYLCFEARSLEDLNGKANAAGLRGWEMSGATSHEGGSGIWCFRQQR